MAHHAYVVFTNPVEGRDDEYNDWYTNQHLDDVMREVGFTAAQRFRLSGMSPEQSCAHRYLAIYEIDTDDIDAVNALMLEKVGAGAVPLSQAMDFTTLQTHYFEAITERKTR